MRKDKKKEYSIYIGIILLAIIAYLSSGSERIPISEEGIARNEPGKGTSVYMIDAETEDKTYSAIEIEVKAREYSEEELVEMAEDLSGPIIQKMLGDNEDLYKVTKDLNLFGEMSGYPFEFTWEREDPQLIDEEGKITDPEPFDTTLIVNLGYKSFSKDFSIDIHAEPGIEIRDRITKDLIKTSIEVTPDENAMITPEQSKYISMPGARDGITYYLSEEPKNPIYLLLGVIAVAGAFVAFRRDEKAEEGKRKSLVISALPGMLQKMTMYLSAGMTLRNIWILLADDAVKKKAAKEGLYAEMTVSANELRSGMSESLVYSRFGERTGTPETVRFAALLSQNLKTGGTSLSDLLRDEATKASTDRKQRAIKAGEEAGTKLLFPMMLLLGDMLAIIMVPAFMNI